MTEKENRKEEMRSLKDAGCDDTFINKCCQCSQRCDDQPHNYRVAPQAEPGISACAENAIN